MNKPFLPTYGTNQQVATTTSSAVTNLAAGRSVHILNKSAVAAEIVYLRIWYSANATEPATVADYPVPAGAARVLSKSDVSDRISIIAASGTPAVEVMVGENGI